MQNSKPVGAAISRPPTFGTERIDQMRNSVRSRAAGSRPPTKMLIMQQPLHIVFVCKLDNQRQDFPKWSLPYCRTIRYTDAEKQKPSWEESVLCDTAILTMTAGNMSLTV